MTDPFEFSPIGHIESPFKQKFGTPRQPGLTPSARSTLRLDAWPGGTRGLEGFSHVWLIFVFHLHLGRGRATARPPRLGGEKRLGVFATRAPYRPNPIGLSVATLVKVEGDTLHLAGADLIDGTPILDLKPYVPYADALPNATSGWVTGDLPNLTVDFSDVAVRAIAMAPGSGELMALITETLRLDPRPAHLRGAPSTKHHKMRLGPVDVHWRVTVGGKVLVVDAHPLK